jgi:protoporphyrinogen oxidase
MAKPHVVILGSGPAGVGAAFQLTRHGFARATVLEQNHWIGGIAGSFEFSGFRMDYGSHRLHPSCDPKVLRDIRTLLDGDLLDRPRHGRIRLRGRWIHFPLKGLDLILRLPPGFSVGVVKDFVAKVLGRNLDSANPESFASALEKGLGRTICRDFYFPYTWKIWGVSPEELSGMQAQRRVSANSLARIVKKLFPRTQGRGHFFYPRYGFGQICEAYAQAAQKAGTEIHLNSHVHSVEVLEDGAKIVSYEKDGEVLPIRTDHVWSTVPVTSLIKGLKPSAPQDVLLAAERIGYRGMILIYLLLAQDQFSEYDTHYFPERDIPISRLSEPKNYSDLQGPPHLTVLCAELPCSPDDAEWDKTDTELGELVCHALEKAGIPIKAPINQIATRRFHQAYPIYHRGYEVDFQRLGEWLTKIDGLLTFGRLGLFVHDNAHHALFMGYCAADCLGKNGSFDYQQWHAFRRIFDTHVVED